MLKSEITCSDDDDSGGNGSVRLCHIKCDLHGVLGLHLSRAPWDPYPWVSGVTDDSSAYHSGIKVGDFILKVNGENVLGLKIIEVAAKIRSHWNNEIDSTVEKDVSFLLWNSRTDENNLTPKTIQKFSSCLQNIALLMECPVCLEVVKPPAWQCCNGHVLCHNCRRQTSRCPICRVALGPKGRCLIVDKLFNLLAETFPCENDEQQKKKTICMSKQTLNEINHQKQNTKKPLTLRKLINPEPTKQLHFKYNCLSGLSSCSRLSSEHELLIHLQKVHKTSVTEYYCALGDRINIKFMDKSVVAIVMPKNGTSHKFFIVKVKCSVGDYNDESLNEIKDVCWVWYLGAKTEARNFAVRLECNKWKWRGQANSIECDMTDILNSRTYTIFDSQNLTNFNVEIK